MVNDIAKFALHYGPTELYVEFVVKGFKNDPKVLVELLGLKNCQFWRKGEPRTELCRLLNKENGFAVRPSLRCKTFEGRILSVLRQVHPHRRILNNLANHRELSIWAYIEGRPTPPLGLPKQAIKMMADLDCTADFDLYFWDNDD